MSEVSNRADARFALVVVFAILSGCGGGGGDGGGTTSPGTGGGGGGGGSAPTNRAPVFGTITFAATEDTDLSAQLTATDADGDALTFTKTGEPKSGTVTSFTAAGAFVYRPNGNFNGSDTFAVRVADPIGNAVDATVTINVAAANDAPSAANDVLRAEGPLLTSIDLLGNDRDPDSDTLTPAVEEAPLVGTATFGSDRKLRLEALPAGFRGLVRLRYRITDGGGLFSVATAAVFVGTDPFRVVFAGETGAAGVPEVYMTDFVSAPWRATLATEGNQRLRGFVASDNGATIVYRRENAGASDLSFVRTTTSDSTAAQQVRLALPAGFTPIADANGADQFAVSPDGQWIAAVARKNSPNGYAVYAINVTTPTTIRDVTPSGSKFITQPRFSANSGRLYFLASQTDADPQGVARKSLYRFDLGSSADTAVQLSRVLNGMNPGDINSFAVSNDDARIALDATRSGRLGVFFIDPSSAGTEVQINHGLAFGEAVLSSTVGLAPGRGGTAALERIGYTVRNFFGGGTTAYVAEVGATPNPRLVASGGATAVGFRSDSEAMLYTNGSQIYEAVIDSTAPQELVGAGTFGVHDSSGETVVLQQGTSLSAARRGAFGSPTAIGSPGQAALFADFSGVPRAVLLIGEGAPGSSPRLVRLALVNARAPDRLLTLADFSTPIDLTSGEARIVTY